MRAVRLLVALAGAWLLAGCGRAELYVAPADAAPPFDTGADTGADTGPDTGVDTGVDGGDGGCRTNADCVTSPATPVCDAASGRCVECVRSGDCQPGATCQGNVCVASCGAGRPCAVGERCCDGLCRDVQSDPGNCGACGRACPSTPDREARCVAGTCSLGPCREGFADCDGSPMNGCETFTDGDPGNCGGCGLRCAAGQMCFAGRCQGGGCMFGCAMGQLCCGEVCIDTARDPANCGGCGRACAAGQRCVDGLCEGGGCGFGPPCGAGQACCGTLCVNTLTDTSNCGGCGVVCGRGGTCVAGTCRPAGCGGGPECRAGTACCGDRCVDTQSDPNNCGACGTACGPGLGCTAGRCTMVFCPGGCAAGQTCCGAACTSTQTDANNCGACGNACPAGTVCAAGTCACACAPGQACCGLRCVDTGSDPANCGGCGVACPARANAAPTCAAGACGLRCAAGFGNCDGVPANGCEVALGADPRNCGACGRVCSFANATGACRGGACAIGACLAAFGNCDGEPTNGCEAALASDPANCGACGRTCGRGQRCEMGRCQAVVGCGDGPPCAAGQACCAGACVTPATDVNNCGACGRACPTPPNATAVCRAATCAVGACLPSYADCNASPADGCEVNTATDAANCGACGRACPSGLACQMGTCAPPSTGMEGAFNPVVNPTFLTPGVHNFTTVRVPAGVVVYLAGGGSESGLLDIRATGDVVVDGTIDVSGGPGGQSTITSRSTRQGRAGAGGFTGDPRTATAGPACEWVAGVSGGNGRGFVGTTGTCRVGSNTTCITDGATQLIFASPAARFGGGGGVFTGYRAYGAGGGGYAGGAPGALGAPYMGEEDCTGTTAGGGASAGRGGGAGSATYDGRNGTLGETQCPGVRPGIPNAYVGGGGGGSVGAAAAADLAVATTFQPGSGGGGGSADYLNRPAFGGTSGGGGGGGALRIWSMTGIAINGRVLANGGDGGDAYIGTNRAAGCDPQPGAAGGGGSGGVVFLRAPRITTGARAQVTAAGGAGGAGSLYATGGAGGSGGLGRIRLSVDPASCALAGMFNPPLASGCTATAGRGVPGRAFVARYPE